MVYVNVWDILPGEWQVRRIFTNLEELGESIKKHGVLEPVLLRVLGDGRYALIGGERRWRAASLVGLLAIPARILHVSDEQALQISLVENVQRSSLSPIEEARGYQALVDRGSTQESVASAIGKSRPYIANALRLLTLPIAVQDMIEKNQLSVGQARAIIGFDDCEVTAREILARKTTVRELEAQRRKQVQEKTGHLSESDYIESLQSQLAQALSLPVEVVASKRGGLIKIRYATWDEADELLDKLRSVSHKT